MDNYYNPVPLFNELQSIDFGAVRTTRLHKDFPAEFKKLKERFASKLKWNTLLAKVVDNTLCLAWQDNNSIKAIYTRFIKQGISEKSYTNALLKPLLMAG
jgi:hypothetical protein